MNKRTMNYTKFVATAATATLVATAIAPVALAEEAVTTPSFEDVSGHYKIPVDYLYNKGIVQGFTDVQFGTSRNIERVDVAVMIGRAILTKEEIEQAEESGFVDVPARAVKHINALKEKGIINGKTATKFESNANITRGEVAMILQRAYKLVGNVENVEFTDVSGHYKEAVAALVDNGITKGKNKTKFGTTDSLTRGELAIFLYNVEQLDVDKELEISSIDVTTDNNKKIATVKAAFSNVPTNSTATVNVFKYDEAGVLGEEAIITKGNLSIENAALDVVVDLGSLSSGKYMAVVKVADVEKSEEFALDFKAVDAAVKAVNDADSQLKLHGALQNPLFKNYDENLIVDYLEELGKGKPAQKTVANVQKVINDVNLMQEDADLIANLKKATTEVQLSQLLKGFDAVDAKLLGSYKNAIALENAVLVTNKDVQGLIDYVNAENTIESLIATKNDQSVPTKLVEGTTQASIDAAQVKVDKLDTNYVLVQGELTKASLQKRLDAVQALFTQTKRAAAGIVGTAAELEVALQNPTLKKITLDEDIVMTSAVALTGNITLDGNDHTLTINTIEDGNSTADGLSISADAEKVLVENIKITTSTHTDNLIEVYGNATLKNVTAKDGEKAGIYVNHNGTGTITVNFSGIKTSGNGWKAGVGIVSQKVDSKVIANFTGTNSFGEETAVYTDNKDKYFGEYEVKGLEGYTRTLVGNQYKWTKKAE